MSVPKYEVRIIFGDTDQMGVVYYANYLRYFEGARAHYWRALGRSYKDLEEAGIALPVVEAHCNYKRPAFYEDLIEVDIGVEDVRGASMRFVYRVTRGHELLADGYTRHATIDRDGRPVRIPPHIRNLLQAGHAGP